MQVSACTSIYKHPSVEVRAHISASRCDGLASQTVHVRVNVTPRVFCHWELNGLQTRCSLRGLN